MINLPRLDSQLMLDEGVRLSPYRDQFGNLTTGVGRNLDANPFTPAEIAYIGHNGRTIPITYDQAIFLLHDDESKVFKTLTAECGWWPALDDVRARVMVDLCFNMGWTKLSGFHTFLSLMASSSFEQAGSDLQGTAWYGQVGNRGPRLVGMVTTGEDYTA